MFSSYDYSILAKEYINEIVMKVFKIGNYIKVLKGEYKGQIFQIDDISINNEFFKVSNYNLSGISLKREDVILATEEEFDKFNSNLQNQSFTSSFLSEI